MNLVGYSYSAEYASLLLAIIMLIFMVYTKPRVTPIYSMVFYGMILSVGVVILQINIISMAVYDLPFGKSIFEVFICGFFALYFFLLMIIFRSVNMLSPIRKTRFLTENKIMLIYAAVYVAGCILTYMYGRLFVITEEGIFINGFLHYNVTCGMVCLMMCFVSVILNRKVLSKVVFFYILIIIPIDFIILIAQQYNITNIFASVTYVVPLVILYIIFNSNPFDEVTGCQNEYALHTELARLIRRKRRFALVYMDFPQMIKTYSEKEKTSIDTATVSFCRQIEQMSYNIQIYRVRTSVFVGVYIYGKNENLGYKFMEDMKDVMVRITGMTKYITYGKMVSCKNNWTFINTNSLLNFVDYAGGMMHKNNENEWIIATDEMYEQYYSYANIMQEVVDIRNNMDLDDERVLCYTQPIYSVKDGRFKTAEALMRLKLDGKIIYPDQFINVAEREDCIHCLTLIILNKVCKKIKEYNGKYDFDAITINCSPFELSDRSMHKDILKVIEDNNVPKNKIRLELTESAMFDNYDNVRYNMDELNKKGILFYLDDFGSGYSNLDRISSCDFYTIKFDKTILYKAMENKNSEAMMSVLIEVIKNQGAKALIEGVEDDRQNDYCIKKGFEYIQGYKYARPVPIEKLPDYFDKL